MIVRQSDYIALYAAQFDMSPVVHGGDILILGDPSFGKTTLAKILNWLCVSAGRKVCVLDCFGIWTENIYGGRRFLHCQDGEIVENGDKHASTTICDFSSSPLHGFDDLIVDDWSNFQFPVLQISGLRQIIITPTLSDALESHDWSYVFGFYVSGRREADFLERCGRPPAYPRLPGKVLLLARGARAETLFIIRD